MDNAALDLAIAFLNTRDGSRDMLTSARRAQRWLAGEAFVGVDSELQRLLPAMHRLAGDGELTDGSVEAARAVRDALLAWIDGDALSDPALEQVRVGVDPGGQAPALRPASKGIMALAEHAFITLYQLHVSGESGRLHRCQADDCRWVFFDRSRNQSKKWCDMSGCGSRAKARAYRARRASLQ